MNDKNNYNNKNSEEEYDDLDIYENNNSKVIKEEKHIHSKQSNDDRDLDFTNKEDDNEKDALLLNKIYNDKISIDKNVFNLIKKILENINEESEKLNSIINTICVKKENLSNYEQDTADSYQQSKIDKASEEKSVIEGIFNGQSMIGFDGKQYSVPVNYASKSKLVEGDVLKLTIANNGAFIYKQISLVERKRVIGKLQRDKNNNFYVESDGKQWKILTASITFFHGEVGDEIVIIIPKQGKSNWAAVENIISKQKYD